MIGAKKMRFDQCAGHCIVSNFRLHCDSHSRISTAMETPSAPTLARPKLIRLPFLDWPSCFSQKPAKKMVNIESCEEWTPWTSANATYRQTGCGLHQRGWSNDACATQQQQLRHELAWIWIDFLNEHLDGFLEQTASGDGFGRDSRGGGKSGWQTTACTMLCNTRDKFAIASMAKKFEHRCMGAHTVMDDH